VLAPGGEKLAVGLAAADAAEANSAGLDIQLSEAPRNVAPPTSPSTAVLKIGGRSFLADPLSSCRLRSRMRQAPFTLSRKEKGSEGRRVWPARRRINVQSISKIQNVCYIISDGRIREIACSLPESSIARRLGSRTTPERELRRRGIFLFVSLITL
jgi:hypothetical protein